MWIDKYKNCIESRFKYINMGKKKNAMLYTYVASAFDIAAPEADVGIAGVPPVGLALPDGHSSEGGRLQDGGQRTPTLKETCKGNLYSCFM